MDLPTFRGVEGGRATATSGLERAIGSTAVAAAVRLLERMPVRAIGVVAAVALAYNYSLQTLLRGLDLQTPLAYLALVPPIAILLGAANFRLQPDLAEIHDRQLDWICGLLLMGVAAVFTVLLPSAYSADYWLHRFDMLGLPFFAAGVVALVYGVRRLWAMRWAIAFLLLAWPDPYVSALASLIGTSTDVALNAVTASLVVMPFVHPLGNGTFQIDNASGSFSLAVGSACSGINSLVGFLLVGAALNTLFRGGLLRRLAWLGVGLVLVGAFNVLRIDLIFLAGWAFGEPFAIDVLHPFAGILVFGVGALAMLSIAPRFGLEIPRPRPGNASTNVTPPPTDGLRPRRTHQVRRPAAAIAASLLLAAMLAVPNAAFASYDSLINAFGQPALGTIDPQSISVPGWTGSEPTEFAQATQYFGANGSWSRIAFAASAPAAGSPSTVYLDVIRTDDSGTLASYGVEACYNFHGFTLVSSTTANVGAGVVAKVANFRSPTAGTDWSILWWEWPYNAGGETRFERLVVLAPMAEADQVGGGTSSATFEASQSTLIGIARTITSQALQYLAPTPDPAAEQ